MVSADEARKGSVTSWERSAASDGAASRRHGSIEGVGKLRTHHVDGHACDVAAVKLPGQHFGR